MQTVKPMTDDEYVRAGEPICPFCRHDIVVGVEMKQEGDTTTLSGFSIDGDCITMKMECDSEHCGKTWLDRYALTGYNEPTNSTQSVFEEHDGRKCYPHLFKVAQEIETKWDERGSIDWQDAEDLIQCLRNTGQDEKLEPMRSDILDYVDTNEDWDSGKVEQWPNYITGALSTTSAGLIKEQIDDECHVFNLRLSGKKEWTASFTTENLATVFISIYQ